MPAKVTLFDEFVSNYVLLSHHVDHVSDLSRIPEGLDDTGSELFQSYLRYETKRMLPIFQATLDSCSESLDTINGIGEQDLENSPNLQCCLEFICELRDSVMPTSDFNEEASLSLEQICSWRDRLFKGMGMIGAIRYFWIADCLGFSNF